MTRLAAPVVKQVAQRLTEGQGKRATPLTIPTLLTEANRSVGRDGVRTKPKREVEPQLRVTKACTACGVVLKQQDRDHCDECLPEEVRASAMAFREKGRAKLEALRAAGEDPAHTETANQRRGATVARAQREFSAVGRRARWRGGSGGVPA